MKNTKKGQAWGLDLIVASILFLGGIIFFYTYSLNLSNESEDIFSKLAYDGNTMSEALLSEGSPQNWNLTNVEKIGLLSHDKINETKLEMFYQLSVTDYQKTKSFFNIKYNYYLFFQKNMTINSLEIEGIGSFPTAPKNLIKITRLTIYKNKPDTLNIHIWE